MSATLTAENYDTPVQYSEVYDTPVSRAPTTTKSGIVKEWTMKKLDAVAGGRGNFIHVVHPSGNKKPGSIAAINYALYGQVGRPSVTVADFIKNYPTDQGGVTRARASLLWDLDRGYIRIAHVG